MRYEKLDRCTMCKYYVYRESAEENSASALWDRVVGGGWVRGEGGEGEGREEGGGGFVGRWVRMLLRGGRREGKRSWGMVLLGWDGGCEVE